MIRRVILSLIFSILFLVQSAFAQEIFKVTSANFDTSNAMIFLTSPDNTQEPILKNIKLTKLTNPNRAFFDIDSSILTCPSQNWFFNSGGLKQIKIGQFSTNPNKVRIVMYFEEGFNPQKVSFLKVNNNIIIKLKDSFIKDNFFQPTYRDEDCKVYFYENTIISNEEVPDVKIAVNTQKKDPVLGQIQQSFNSSTAPSCAVKPIAEREKEIIKKELKLNSKYYLDGFYPSSNGVLVNGFGSVGVEKPIYLADPARVVFDIPNAIMNPALKGKEIKISDKETARVAQFSSNKVRVVITTPELEKFQPIFSADGQSLLFANPDKIDTEKLFSKTTDAVAYFYKDVDKKTDEFIMAFNSPVVHSIRRDNSKLTIYLYNALRFNEQNFKNSIKSTSLNDFKLEVLPKVGLKLTLPLKKESVVETFLGADAKSIRIRIKGPKTLPAEAAAIISQPIKKVILSTRPKGTKRVVIDPGHGGSDYGAIRAGINEKDINLDVAKRVQALLTSKGVQVEMTRDRDETVSLQARTEFSANANPDVFVSIHVNSSTGTQASGIETHYYHPESIELAQTVHSSLASCVKSPDRGLFKSRFYVINHTSVPAILVEIGFISNERERAELVSEQRKQQTAKSIAEGILEYLNKK